MKEYHNFVYNTSNDYEIPVVIEFWWEATSLNYPDSSDPYSPAEDPKGSIEIENVSLDEEELKRYYDEPECKEITTFFNKWKDDIENDIIDNYQDDVYNEVISEEY